MQITWRFYCGTDQFWRWQQLSDDRAVTKESAAGFSDYDLCLADAREAGYRFVPGTAMRQPKPLPQKRERTVPISSKVRKSIRRA